MYSEDFPHSGLDVSTEVRRAPRALTAAARAEDRGKKIDNKVRQKIDQKKSRGRRRRRARRGSPPPWYGCSSSTTP